MIEWIAAGFIFEKCFLSGRNLENKLVFQSVSNQ